MEIGVRFCMYEITSEFYSHCIIDEDRIDEDRDEIIAYCDRITNKWEMTDNLIDTQPDTMIEFTIMQDSVVALDYEDLCLLLPESDILLELL